MNSVLIWALAVLVSAAWFLSTRRGSPLRLISGVILSVMAAGPLALFPIMLLFNPRRYC